MSKSTASDIVLRLYVVERKTIRRIFWVIIILGLVTPLSYSLSHLSYVDTTRSFINYFICLPLLNVVPFLIYALLVKSQLGKLELQRSPLNFRNTAGMIGAGITTLGYSLLVHIVVSTSKSSTAVIAFLFIPVYGIILMPIGYACGWLLGKLGAAGPDLK